MGTAILALLSLAALRGLTWLHGYLATGSQFPQPLEPVAERREIERMRAGEPEARNNLIEHNLRLVAHIVKKFDGSGEDPEDLISIGVVGLIKGVETFDPGKGTRLATYAARCIENEIARSGPPRRRAPARTDRPGRARRFTANAGTRAA